MYERLKEIRRELGMNQTEFADSLGIRQAAYSLIETGKKPLAKRYIKTICALYKINENWFLSGEGEMWEEPTSEQELVELYRKMPANLQKTLVNVARDFAQIR